MLAVALMLSTVVEDRVFMIEVNQMLNFQQVIFWDWDKEKGLVVVDWRYRADCPSNVVRARDGFTIEWMDDGAYRRVTANVYCESQTINDPELKNQEVLPCYERRLLSRR